MLRNIVFVFISMCLMVSCDSVGSNKNTAVSPMESGKIYLADADRMLEDEKDKEAKKLYKKAIAEFETAAREDANQKGLASLLGQSQYRVRDFNNAIQWLNKAGAQDKLDIKAHQYLGYCLVNKSKIKEAETAFRKAFNLDGTGEVRKEIIRELTDIGELSITLGSNFTSQGKPAQGVEFKKLGMRIMAMGLEYSKYDLNLAREIQKYANEMQDQILMDWIANVISGEENKTTSFEIKK